MTSEFRHNHYVPVWYQEGFLPLGHRRRFHYLDLRPETQQSNGRVYVRRNRLEWGPSRCFAKNDLYTTRFGGTSSTDVEKFFFGRVDADGRDALAYWRRFEHPSVEPKRFRDFLNFMSVQKMRTPKGLREFAALAGAKDQNRLMLRLQQYQNLFCALWTEAIWSIVDASESPTKFLLSDHPVTTYNCGWFPGSANQRQYGDAPIELSGTHTLFPLALDKMLVLTNLSWARNPYGNPMRERPNPEKLRTAMFNFTAVQTGRKLNEHEVLCINFIIKNCADRYLAAFEPEWLYPEERLSNRHWDRFGKAYLLHPDPRSMQYTSEIIIGYAKGQSYAFDEFGRRPWHPDYSGRRDHTDDDWHSFHAFRGEYARIFGPIRRGRTFEFNKAEPVRGDDEWHKANLHSEAYHKARMRQRTVKDPPKRPMK